MRRALVTGGGGFIGSNIVKLLLDRAVDVRVLDNFSSGYRENLERFPGVQVFEADIRDVDSLDRAVAGVDVVFHLAASVGNARSIADPVGDSAINVMGTLRVLEAARHHGVRKVIFSSSAGIFGELKALPIREDHPAEPDSPYGASKLAAEKLSLVYAKLYGVECICLRYFNVYGLNQRYDAYGNVIPIFAQRALRGLPLVIFGDGEQTRDFVNVRDVAAANYQAAMTPGLSGAFNIASGTGTTINRLAALVVEFTGADSAIEYAAPRQGDVRHSVADISGARAAFKFEPSVPLMDGLGDYLAWAKRVMT
jgi:UDP-glucose 4-epimerase